MALALSYSPVKESLIRSGLGDDEKRIDVWAPESNLGYVKLIYFGMLVAAICIGGNTALGSIWTGMVIEQ